MATLPPLPPLAEEYLRALQVERGLARTTLAEYRRDLHDFCRSRAEELGKDPGALGLEDLARVDRERARAWLAHLHERELARATLARRLSAVGGLFRWLAAEGRISLDPFTAVRRPTGGARHRRSWSTSATRRPAGCSR